MHFEKENQFYVMKPQEVLQDCHQVLHESHHEGTVLRHLKYITKSLIMSFPFEASSEGYPVVLPM